MINKVQNLLNDYRTTEDFSTEYTLNFFSKHAILFNNFKTFADEDELKSYIQLSWQHCNALFSKGRFNETTDSSIKYLELIDREIFRLNLPYIKDDWYYGLISLQGRSVYRLRAYKESTRIFKQLVSYDPQNESYQTLLNWSLYGQRLWISKSITIICMALIAIEFFFKEQIPSLIARMSILGIALIGLIGTGIYDLYIKRSGRKRTKK